MKEPKESRPYWLVLALDGLAASPVFCKGRYKFSTLKEALDIRRRYVKTHGPDYPAGVLRVPYNGLLRRRP